MAAGLGFKDFTTGEVLTAADVDGYLMQGIWVFASAAARDAAVTSPQEGNACYLKDTDVIQVYTGSAWAAQSASNPISANIVDAKGDLIVGTAADTVSRLAVGTNGYTLVADSAAATGLKWAAPAGGGKVLQVVYGSYQTETTSASSTFTTTNLTANITPSLSSSKVLVLVNQSGCMKFSSSTALMLRLKRDSTVISNFERAGGETATSATNGFGTCSTSVLDTPATTSSITYVTEMASQDNTGTVAVNADTVGVTTLSTMILMEIGA